MSDTDLKVEQERVAKVTGIVRKRLNALSEALSSIRANVVDIRKNFWDDVTVNLENTDDRAETRISLKQQAEVLNEQERSHRLAEQEFNQLSRLAQTPYFGRIDFEEEGFPCERIYIGTASLMDDDGERFYVYDWRAPIASLYYDYPPGPASYLTPGGEIRGRLELKRQFVIRRGKIVSMFDTGLTIGDELLQEVLGRHSDAQMKTIVATIQKEQNRIIRHDHKKLLIVQGAAGSGKTSAALQRVAYLLYKYRNKITSDQIVLFSPNSMFNSYISHVLPELGEYNMLQATMQEYLEVRLGRRFQVEDPFAQMEYVLTGRSDKEYATRIRSIDYKSSVEFLHAIQGYAERLSRHGMIFKDLKFRGNVLIAKEDIAEAFYAGASDMRLSRRVQQAVEWLKAEIKRIEAEQYEADWVDEDIQTLDAEDYQRIHKRMRREMKKAFAISYETEQTALAKMVVKRAFKPIKKRIQNLKFIDIHNIYRQLYADPGKFGQWTGMQAVPEKWAEICWMTVDDLDRRQLAYEEATPYLYLQELIEGFQTNTKVKYVLIDEAQDYSPFQFEFLKRLFPGSRITALGDFNQAIFAHAAGRDSFEVLQQLVPPGETETLHLNKSYRSTRPIIEFTRLIAANGEQIEPFNRTGPKPVVIRVQDRERLHAALAEQLIRLREKGMESIAVICKTAEESETAYAGLTAALSACLASVTPGEAGETGAGQDRLSTPDNRNAEDAPAQPRHGVELQLVRKETRTFPNGAVVIPAYLAKGVEFDAVLIYDASAARYGDESERRLFYTACTRAMHELYLYTMGEQSRFIPDESTNTYEIRNRAAAAENIR